MMKLTLKTLTKNQKIAIAIGTVAVIAIWLISSGKKNSATPQGIPVEVTSVLQHEAPFILQLSGTTEAYETVSVKAQVTGQLLKINFKEGDAVKANDLLFEIDSRTFVNQLNQSQANLERDQAQYANAVKEEIRYSQLLKKGFATQEQYEQVLATRDGLKATIDGDKAAIETAKLQIEYSKILSPTDGRIGEVAVHEGDIVPADGTTAMVVINKISPLYVSFFIAEDY